MSTEEYAAFMEALSAALSNQPLAEVISLDEWRNR